MSASVHDAFAATAIAGSRPSGRALGHASDHAAPALTAIASDCDRRGDFAEPRLVADNRLEDLHLGCEASQAHPQHVVSELVEQLDVLLNDHHGHCSAQTLQRFLKGENVWRSGKDCVQLLTERRPGYGPGRCKRAAS